MERHFVLIQSSEFSEVPTRQSTDDRYIPDVLTFLTDKYGSVLLTDHLSEEKKDSLVMKRFNRYVYVKHTEQGPIQIESFYNFRSEMHDDDYLVEKYQARFYRQVIDCDTNEPEYCDLDPSHRQKLNKFFIEVPQSDYDLMVSPISTKGRTDPFPTWGPVVLQDRLVFEIAMHQALFDQVKVVTNCPYSRRKDFHLVEYLTCGKYRITSYRHVGDYQPGTQDFEDLTELTWCKDWFVRRSGARFFQSF